MCPHLESVMVSGIWYVSFLEKCGQTWIWHPQSGMAGYTKLFASLLSSTLWVQESKETKLVWITMLAMKNGRQVVESSIPGLAKAAGVTIGECEDALVRLRSPDAYSRTKDHEGRRIEDVDGGWVILNGEKYRDKLSLEERKEYKRTKEAEYRKRRKHLNGQAQKEGATQAVKEGLGDWKIRCKGDLL